MNISNKTRAAGLTAGLAIFFAVGLLATVAAETSSASDLPVPGPIPEATVAPAEQLGKAFAAVAAHVKPAVVSVYSEKVVKMQVPEFQFPFGGDMFHQFFGQQGQPAPKMHEYRVPQGGMGSGMILDQQGHILTNYHVVANVDQIKVRLADKRTFRARIVGTDPKTDVAVLQIEGDIPKHLPVVQLGDSDAMHSGNLVMAIGAPFGLVQTVTTGIISAKGRSDVGIATFEDFLQTDAPINPGNSGGPLVNMRGEVIGMNSAIATGGASQFAGVGFAIPSNMIKAMLPTLLKGGHIQRGMLGVVIQDVTQDLASQFDLPTTNGALIAQVNKGSPADKAGLKPGDAIVSFDGKPVGDTDQLRNMVAATAPGTTVNLGVIRNGAERTVSVTVGKLGQQAAAKPSGEAAHRLAALGLDIRALTPELASKLGLEGDSGVLIAAVKPGSPAWAASLQAGDLIVQADRKPVKSVTDLQKALDAAKDQILLLIKRQGASMFVVFRLK